MEFWGAEVKSGQSLVVEPGKKLLHLSQGCLDDLKKAKGSDPISLFAKIGNQKLALGFLSADKYPQLMFDIVFDQKFELSHNWKNGSVHFTGYKSLGNEESDSEEEDAPPIRAPTLVDKGKAKVNGTEVAKKPSISEQKEASSDDDDESDDEEFGDQSLAKGDSGEDFDESDDDSDSDDETDDSDEDEETPKKADVGKKRPAESTKTPANDKKPKFVTPEKTGSKKGSVHTATPHPSKQTGKKPATSDQSKQQASKPSGAFHCQPCNRSFNSDGALQSHTKAKHSAAK
ncbi:histone deacetylase HDT1-like [Pyrus communis]|uniref:histone deacetylase HDT1-like n=1 Tax=Pyrus communis TaxID=23211 RepID=UPI0035BEEAF2